MIPKPSTLVPTSKQFLGFRNLDYLGWGQIQENQIQKYLKFSRQPLWDTNFVIFADHVLCMKNITFPSRKRLSIFVFTSRVFCFVLGFRSSRTRKQPSCSVGRTGGVAVPSLSCLYIYKKKNNKKQMIAKKTVI